ncbi:NACHT and WD domain protein [Xylaria sp. FL1042]|nr:NACHT and WD domain protein [Xylaria sp. FL1042]
MFRKLSAFRAKGSRDASGSQIQDSVDPLSHDTGSIPASRPEPWRRGGSTTLIPTLPSSSVESDSIQSRRNSESEPGPLGLSVVYTPENGHKADIVFIHGLGGTSRLTWSKNKNPKLFWPLTFLPLEPDLCLARILTFGYNTNFLKSGNLSTSVLDFAKGLLFDLKYAKDESKNDLNMGEVPLIFVVHSMGGLIVKEAYMQGQNDPEYEAIVRAITAITFLATPHRGTNLAETLNRILQSALITNSKHYVAELVRNSFALQKLNEQFRHIAPRLDIVSFYETQPTSISLKSARIMVLEKDSSVLGYPGEISKALDADHHGVCKFESPKDSNYVTVRNVLKSLMSKIISTKKLQTPEASDRKNLESVRSFLGLKELPATDYTFFRDRWIQGTCDWVLKEETFNRWLSTEDSASGVLWLNGSPASGKSVLSSFIINYLTERKICCQYFYIRFGDRTKRTLSLLLRSIAYQIAQADSNILHEVIDLKEEATDIENSDPKIIWQRIYKSIFFKAGDLPPLYWVVDGLDEAENPQAILRLFHDLSVSPKQIRVLFTSRRTLDLTTAIMRIPHTLYLGEISVESHVDDVRCYVTQELAMSGTTEFKQNITTRILEGAQNNFLWVRLAVEKLNACHRLADVELALQQLPEGMEALYGRMVSSIPKDPLDKALAIRILKSIVCALRILTVIELSQALGEDTSELLDIHKSIVNLCGGLVVVDNDGNVSMVHQTAREYLLDPTHGDAYIDRNLAHEELFFSCMKCLTTAGLRAKLNRGSKPEFLDYAACFWSSHLVAIKSDSEPLSDTLRSFLKSQAVLTWIHFLASEGKLHVLVLASKHISKYASKQQKRSPMQGEESQRMMDRVLIENWAVDLIKLVGKFGAILTKNPESIYKEVPPLCPHNSSIYQQFGSLEAKSLRVSGISTDDWDDSLSRLPLPGTKFASSITTAGSHIAILSVSGSVFLYDSSTFEETSISPVNHHERIYRMELDRAASLLVTYGYRTTKVWETSSGKCKRSVDNLPSKPRPLTMLLSNNNKTLLIGFDDRRIRSLNICETAPTWELVADLEEPELEGHFFNSANYMTLSKDSSLMAVAYRGHPLSAWEVDGPIHLGHCWRKREEVSRGEVIDAVWNPQAPEVLGLYIEGVVFKWQPYDDYVEELPTGASKIAISDDGSLFAAGNAQGIVKLYTTSDFSLLYQLASQDTVLGLAFSPDSRRFYDIRGYYGNVWEPNILMRYAEHASTGFGDDNDTESQALSSTATAMRTYQRVDNITVLSSSPVGKLYCYGTERGILYLHHTERGRLANLHTSRGHLSIEKLAWSPDGRLVAFTDSSKKLFIIPISPAEKGNTEPVVGPTMEMSIKDATKGHIHQVLLHSDTRHVLVFTSTIVHVISIATLSIERSIALDTIKARWVLHPLNDSKVLGFDPQMVYRIDWCSGSLVSHQWNTGPPTDQGESPNDEASESEIDRVLVTHDKKHILVQISRKDQAVKRKHHFHFDTASIGNIGSESLVPDHSRGRGTVKVGTLPESLSAQITNVLAFLPQSRLVYLSRGNSICSWKILSWTAKSPAPGGPRPGTVALSRPTSIMSARKGSQSIDGSPVKQLFSLPSDWVSKDSLVLSMIWVMERSYLCPKNGEVAIIRCAALI